MAKWLIATPEVQAQYEKWFSERPIEVQEAARKHNIHPDVLYRIKDTDFYCVTRGLPNGDHVVICPVYLEQMLRDGHPEPALGTITMLLSDIEEADLPHGVKPKTNSVRIH